MFVVGSYARVTWEGPTLSKEGCLGNSGEKDDVCVFPMHGDRFESGTLLKLF